METINGYSVNDKSRLQAEIEQFRRKRNTSLGVGISLSVIAIIGIIVVAAMLVNQMYEYAQSHGSVSESELYSAFMGQIALIYLFSFVETADNIIALADGISNHVKMANRRRTLERLRNLE